MIDGQSNARDIIEHATDTAAAESMTFRHRDGRDEQVLITRDKGGTRVQLASDLIAKNAAAPERREGAIVTHDLASFIGVVNRDKRTDSVIFANVAAKLMVAVLDFHGPADSAPRWGRDRVAYGFQLSPQLLAWIESTRAPLNQKAFSRLIDDRIGDVGEGVLEPGSLAEQFASRRGIRFAGIADLLVFTRTIAARSLKDAVEEVDPNTGNVSIRFAKTNNVSVGGDHIDPPLAFFLRIPVLNGLGATEFNIAVRLRFDIDDDGIEWKLEIHALDKYIAAAIEEALMVVRRSANHVAAPTPDGKSVAFEPVGCGLPVYLAAIP